MEPSQPAIYISNGYQPGHKDIEGNEQADQAAKTAATSSTTPPNIRMKSAQNRSMQSMTKTIWNSEMKASGSDLPTTHRSLSFKPISTLI